MTGADTFDLWWLISIAFPVRVGAVSADEISESRGTARISAFHELGLEDSRQALDRVLADLREGFAETPRSRVV